MHWHRKGATDANVPPRPPLNRGPGPQRARGLGRVFENLKMVRRLRLWLSFVILSQLSCSVQPIGEAHVEPSKILKNGGYKFRLLFLGIHLRFQTKSMREISASNGIKDLAPHQRKPSIRIGHSKLKMRERFGPESDWGPDSPPLRFSVLATDGLAR